MSRYSPSDAKKITDFYKRYARAIRALQRKLTPKELDRKANARRVSR